MLRLFSVAVLLSVSLVVATLPSVAAGAVAHWEGNLNLPGNAVAIVVDLAADESGAWRGEIDIPSQGIRNLALSGVAVDGASVTFAMSGIPGNPTFRGSLAEDGASLAGNLVQGGQQLPFRLERKGDPLFGHVADDGVKLVETGSPGEGPAGEWHGVLVAGPSQLRMIVIITAVEDGTFTAVLESVDQGRAKFPVDQVLWDPEVGDVGLNLERIGAGYVGRLNADGSEMSGDWEQGPAALPLSFKRK